MFNVKTIEKFSADENKVVVRGIAISSKFYYGDNNIAEFFESIQEVGAAELVYHRDHIGGDNLYSVILTPAEGHTADELIVEVPQYQPQDEEGNYDNKEIKAGFAGLNIFEDGKPAQGRARHTLYQEGV